MSANLNTAQQVPKPHGAKNGIGVFTATSPTAGVNYSWTLSINRLAWSHLSSPVTEVEIHLGKAGKVGPDAGTILCWFVAGNPPCVSGLHGAQVEMPPATAKAIVHGVVTYVEVHTKKNPKGEIRGQIKLIG